MSAAGSSAGGAPMLAAGGAVVGSGVVGSLETATTELLCPKCQVVRISQESPLLARVRGFRLSAFSRGRMGKG